MLFDFLKFKKDKDYWIQRGYELTHSSKKKHDYQEALKCFIKALSLDPDNGFAWNGKGYVLFCLRKYDRALECFDKALKIEDQPEFRENKAKVLIATGKAEEIKTDMHREEEMKEEKEDWSVWNKRGNSMYQLGKYEEAIKCYNKVLAIDKGDNTCGWGGLIRTYKTMGDYERALDSYSSLLGVIPHCKETRKEKGDLAYHLGKYNQAIECYDRVLRLAPDIKIDLEALCRKGDSLCELGKYEEGIKSYDKAIELNLSDKAPRKKIMALTLNRKGIALKKTGKIDEGNACFREAIRWSEKAFKEAVPEENYFVKVLFMYEKGKALYEKIKALCELEKKDETIKFCKELILYWDNLLEENKKFMAWYFFYEKAKVLCHTGEFEEAIKCYNSAIELKPDSIEIHNSKRECCHRALEVDPKNFPALCEKGSMLYLQGKFKDAVRCFDSALETDPKSFRTLYNRGLASFARGDSQGAIESYDKALEIEPDNSSLLAAKGSALYIQGNNEEALKCFNRSLEIEAGNADVWYKKGVTLGVLDKKEEAQKCMDKILEVDPLFTFPADPVRYWYHKWCYRVI